MTLPDRFSLAGLDNAAAVNPDPLIWPRNLTAVRLQQPQFASELEPVTLPDHWRCVRALDGSVTFRLEQPGAEPLWLAGTAAPATRAEGLLGTLNLGEQNAVLPALAAGAELRYLLDRLPPHRAVYVFEDDLSTVAAVLRLHDYSQDIETGRLILVPPSDEARFVEHQMSAHPGLLPPGLIICVPHVPQPRLEQIRTICERTAHASHAARSRRLQELSAAVPAAVPSRPPRLALLALKPDPLARRCAHGLETAARRLGWPVLPDIVRTPRDVHALVHAERLAAFAPSLILCLGQPFELRLSTQAAICEWHLRAGSVANSASQPAFKLGASPHISDLLRLSCPAGSRVLDWYFGCEPLETSAPPADAVLLIGDLPDDDPARAGVEQPSHKLLWKHAEQCVKRLWSDGKLITAAVVLKHAERAAELGLPPGEVRAALLEAIERTLIPAALQRTIRQVLSSGAFEFGTIGRGWTPRADSQKEAVTFCSIWDFMAQPRAYRPIAAVFTGINDPLSPELLQAGALGWPLLLYGPGGSATTAALGSILRPTDYRPFMDPRGLISALQDCRGNPAHARERAAQTAQHLSARHSCAQRLLQLDQWLQAGTPGPP